MNEREILMVSEKQEERAKEMPSSEQFLNSFKDYFFFKSFVKREALNVSQTTVWKRKVICWRAVE